MQLTIREGVTELTPIQKGVGYTEPADPETAAAGEGQKQLANSDQEKATASDGGTPDAEEPETAGTDDVEATESTVPDDAEGLLADAQRLRNLLDQRGIPLDENELVVAATAERDLMNPERAKAALEYAVTEKGIIMETGDGYTPT